MENKIIACDFDNTLSYGVYPQCGNPNLKLIEWLKKCQKNGCKLILWTYREGKTLETAVQWCKGYGLKFDAINENLPEMIEKYGNNCRKIGCDIYIDDTHFTSEFLIKKTKVETEAQRPKARII